MEKDCGRKARKESEVDGNDAKIVIPSAPEQGVPVSNQLQESSQETTKAPSNPWLKKSPSALPYLQDALKALIAPGDTLLVMARGLEMPWVFESYLQLTCTSPKHKLVFVLGCTTSGTSSTSSTTSTSHNSSATSFSASSLLYGLKHHRGVPEHLLPVTVQSSYSTEFRRRLYIVGGVFFITPAILLNDLLNRTVTPAAINGLLFANAHTIKPNGPQAFLARLYRAEKKSLSAAGTPTSTTVGEASTTTTRGGGLPNSSEGLPNSSTSYLNSTGFIKAVSDRPEWLARGFSGVGTLMRCLFLNNLSLWPRFHRSVVQSFVIPSTSDNEKSCHGRETDDEIVKEKNKKSSQSSDDTFVNIDNKNVSSLDVEEIHLPLSPSMSAIQDSILELMQNCLKFISNSASCDLSTSSVNLTIENALFDSFHATLRAALNPQWHRLSFKLKQVVRDVWTLKQMLDLLLRYDAIKFWQHVEHLVQLGINLQRCELSRQQREAQRGGDGNKGRAGNKYSKQKGGRRAGGQSSSSLRNLYSPQWVTYDAANDLIDHAKSRVYEFVTTTGPPPTRKDSNTKSSNAKTETRQQQHSSFHGPSLLYQSITGKRIRASIKVQIEECPKLKMLKTLLSEIEDNVTKKKHSTENNFKKKEKEMKYSKKKTSEKTETNQDSSSKKRKRSPSESGEDNKNDFIESSFLPVTLVLCPSLSSFLKVKYYLKTQETIYAQAKEEFQKKKTKKSKIDSNNNNNCAEAIVERRQLAEFLKYIERKEYKAKRLDATHGPTASSKALALPSTSTEPSSSSSIATSNSSSATHSLSTSTSSKSYKNHSSSSTTTTTTGPSLVRLTRKIAEVRLLRMYGGALRQYLARKESNKESPPENETEKKVEVIDLLSPNDDDDIKGSSDTKRTNDTTRSQKDLKEIDSGIEINEEKGEKIIEEEEEEEEESSMFTIQFMNGQGSDGSIHHLVIVVNHESFADPGKLIANFHGGTAGKGSRKTPPFLARSLLDFFEQVQPTHVILFEPEAKMIRTVEVYHARRLKFTEWYKKTWKEEGSKEENKGGKQVDEQAQQDEHTKELETMSSSPPLQQKTPAVQTPLSPPPSLHVYMLVFKNTIEMQKFSSDQKKERNAFKRLLDFKTQMILPTSGKATGVASGMLPISRDHANLYTWRSQGEFTNLSANNPNTITNPNVSQTTSSLSLKGEKGGGAMGLSTAMSSSTIVMGSNSGGGGGGGVAGNTEIAMRMHKQLSAVSNSNANSNAYSRRGSYTSLSARTLAKLKTTSGLVIVDTRELRSPLPFLLHCSAQLQILSRTLIVGDYILSPEVCVERKAIPDLIQSLQSGRLWTQVEAMCRHYTVPILLIEFNGQNGDEDNSTNSGITTSSSSSSATGASFARGLPQTFNFTASLGSSKSNTYSSMGGGVQGGRSHHSSGNIPDSGIQSSSTSSWGKYVSTIQAKLSLLSIHKPQLKIIWSCSPKMTVKIFQRLKQNRAEPNALIAESKGNETMLGDLVNGTTENVSGGSSKQDTSQTKLKKGKNTVQSRVVHREDAVRMLLRLPGFHTENIYSVLNSGVINSLHDLATADPKKIEAYLGKSNARALHTFINQFSGL
eukprot:g1783.t1